MESASNRLMIVVPIALILIFAMIYMALGNVRNSVLVFTGVPFALTGGVIALALRDIHSLSLLPLVLLHYRV
jgi:cobalt-zinc-cadmium resistance protein CzcA